MKKGAKSHLQSERDKKQKGNKPQSQSKLTAETNLTNLPQNGLENLTAADIIALQQTYGNRAVSRMMRQNPEEDKLDFPGPRSQPVEEDKLKYPGPRSQRAGEGALEYPGPRTRTSQENGGQQRGSSERSSAPGQRAAPSMSATGELGDAIDLDGEALYGWNRTITADDVATVVNGVVPTMSSEEETEFPRIVIFSGTHGNTAGHLVNDATSRGFVGEDQATANAVMAANPGVRVEVIDVVTSYTEKEDVTSIYGMDDYIRILGWCYSSRSYGLGDNIKSNWWADPDSL